MDVSPHTVHRPDFLIAFFDPLCYTSNVRKVRNVRLSVKGVIDYGACKGHIQRPSNHSY